jgi:NHLM bacteriocin system ABC transporter peptidase/ATP-binding protein
MEAVECGAASLSIILSHYKCFLPLEELRIACGVSRDGSTAAHIISAAEHYGLTADAYQKSLQDLKELKPPYIIFWDFNHFLVVEGFSKKGVWLNDPAFGPKLVSWDEFSQKFTGIVITFEPTAQFKPKGSPSSVITALKNRFKGEKFNLIYLFAIECSLIIPTLATASFARVFIDDILTLSKFNWKIGLTIAMLITLLLQTLLIWFEGKCLYRLNAFLSVKLSSEFFRHMLKLPMHFYQQRTSGDISWRVQLNDQVVNNLTQQIAKSLLNAIMIIFYAAVMFLFNYIIALIVIAGGILNMLLLIWINRSRTNAMSCLVQNYLKMTGYSVNGLQNIETIKSLGLESDFFSKWAGYNADWLIANQEFTKKNIIIDTLSPLFKTLITIGYISIGALLVMRGELSLGSLMALQVIVNQFIQPLTELITLGRTLQEVKINLLRLDDTLDNKMDKQFLIIHKKEVIKDAKLRGNLELKNISFGYNPTEEPFIKNFSLSVKPGEVVALVGKTGCGKTTIAKIILGLYHPTVGTVLYDDSLRENIPNEILHNSINFVDQEIFLFSTSIRNNITLWNSTISETILLKAAKDALIHETILTRPMGYEHKIKEGGQDLSGGERQRLEIARSLITNPSILILDEATSALDSVTEAQVLQNIKRRNCSCVIVAHRLSTIKSADKIIVLDNGKIIQTGNHETLKKQKGLYQELITVRGE